MIELGYSGCSDSLFGNIFIPQPPSAELEIEYDPCIPDVFAELIDLEGMALNFDWSLTDNVGVNYDFLMSDDSQETPVPNPIPLSQLNLPTDTTFYIEVEVFNFCESLTLEDTVNYIAAPSIEIDIANTSGDLFCLPQEFDFEIGEFATAYIDSVSWIFESIYDYGNVTDTTYTNLQFPPSLTFENNGQTDTVNVYVTAYNQCGLDQDTINFVLIPPNVYLEMPDFFEGVCPGDGIDIPTLIVEGDPFNGCEVTSSPLIPGLTFGCSENFESVSVFIPESTPPGTYSIETTISGCGSSNDFTEIEIFTVPDVDFEFDDQVCTDTEVAFTNLTEGAVSFEWDFGELGAIDNTSILSFPIYAYEWPGIYDVTLTAFSDSNCVASVTKPIEIFGPNPSFEIDSAQICSGGTAVVEFESQDDIISLLWEFVLPGEDTLLYTVEQSVANTFFNDSNNVDVWNVSLTLEDIYGCVARADTQVIVLPQPTAFFRHNSLEGCAQGVPIDFYNLSTANTSSTWSFDNPLSNVPSIKYETNPTYEFPQPGIYTVTLLTQNQYGCEAQFARILGCNKVDVYVPNAFTPDGNSLNEVFIPVVPGIESIVFTEANFYTFQVFDRWGLMVFETHDYQEGWAGTSPNAEFYAPSDVYIWRLEINFPEGLEKWTGHVTLVR
jgi:gliding motility-associated-like protein